MSSSCSFIFMQIKFIFIRMVLHLESLWNRGVRELGNGLLKANWQKNGEVIERYSKLVKLQKCPSTLRNSIQQLLLPLLMRAPAYHNTLLIYLLTCNSCLQSLFSVVGATCFPRAGPHSVGNTYVIQERVCSTVYTILHEEGSYARSGSTKSIWWRALQGVWKCPYMW